MPRGISVHVGVNTPDPVFGVTPLEGCVSDATSMRDIAVGQGFEATLILDTAATFDNVEAAILAAAGTLQSGDIFLFTFAGHGSFRSTTVLIDEDDGQDERILLHDCVLIDNYLRRNLWSQFVEGVRILGVADSCHSGSVLTTSPLGPSVGTVGVNVPHGGVDAPAFEGSTVGGGGPEFQPMPQPVGTGVAVRHEPGPSARGVRGFTAEERERIVAIRPEIHARLRKELNSGEAARVKASLLSLAACRDNEEALDGPEHGAFTQALLDVWNGGPFDGNYDQFIGLISARFSASGTQHPIRQPPVVVSSFLDQRPFTI